MIGRRKVLKAISFDRLKKKIRKNAKKGAYKKYQRSDNKFIKDTIVVPDKKIEILDTVIAPLVAAPILKADSLITLNEFLFEIDSYKLKVEQLEELDSIAKFLKSHPTLEVNISGHTDNTGSERHNISLSTRRAEVVAEYLIDKGAVYDRVTYRGYGSSQPIDNNETEKGRRKNRRVEILISNPIEK
jgi:outer membrane protein OmpA-like peptidoglycan-associated protein